MTDLRKAAEMALEALEDIKKYVTDDGAMPENWDAYHEKPYFALEALRQALAQPEQEPVAFRKMAHGTWFYIENKPSPPNDDYEPPFSDPPSVREWVSLTDDDRIEIFNSMDGGIYGFLKTWGWLNFSKALEAKLKERNNG